MTNPLKPGMRVEYVHANEPWQATVARVDGELFWLRDYSDGDDTESVYWHWSPHVFRILTPDYPKYATLDDIPITPGMVEWRGNGWDWIQRYDVRGITSASGDQSVTALDDSPEHRHGATVGQVIHDFACALAAESDEAWLRKRGEVAVFRSRTKTGAWSASFEQYDERGLAIDGWWTTKPAAFAALRRAVEALESGE